MSNQMPITNFHNYNIHPSILLYLCPCYCGPASSCYVVTLIVQILKRVDVRVPKSQCAVGHKTALMAYCKAGTLVVNCGTCLPW